MVDKRQRVIRWVGVCADIHDHKVLEEALARSNEDLQRFAFAASHDLQEPLKMIGVFSELLIRKQAENTESNYLVAQITRGVRRMQELIQSTLEYSRIRAEDVGMLSEISLEQPLSEAVWSLQNAIAEARAEITSDPLPMVVADAGMISRVFQNLIQNAIRFRNDEPPQIRIGSRTEKDTVVVFVSDNGIGIAKDYAESVFEPFRRLHPQGGQRGSGLGLTSVKRIIELHRGRVWLESEPGKGSTFFFTLPLARNRANGDTAGGMASRPAMA
jgi:light-regulated signal transduction histidine kinase (bacteriophytochrome)